MPDAALTGIRACVFDAYGTVFDFASAAVVPLSSIRQPASLIGYTAVDLLLKEAASGEGFTAEQVVFQPELVVRDSTRRR